MTTLHFTGRAELMASYEAWSRAWNEAYSLPRSGIRRWAGMVRGPMVDNYLKTLTALCKKHGVELVEKSPGHFHLKGAAYLVNYYPLSKARTAYVAGTTEAIKYATPAQAVAIAAGTEGFKITTIDRRPKNSKAKRWRLWEAGKRSCFWCCEPFAIFAETTLEHIIPLSRGGLDNPNNYALSHERCNRDRGNLLPHQPAPVPESPTVSRAVAFDLLKLQHQAKQDPGRYAEKLTRKQGSLQAWDEHFPDGTVFPPIRWTGGQNGDAIRE